MDDTITPDAKPRGVTRLIVFIIIATVGIVISCFTPVGEFFTKEAISRFARDLGYWGPAAILLGGLVSPLLFLPRWPLAFVSGLLYGVVWGTIISNIASTLGAWINFMLAKNLLAPMADRVRRKYALARLNVPEDKAFWILFLLLIRLRW